MLVEYHPLFWKNVEAQALYLEKESKLGSEFLDKVDEAIASVKSIPESHSRLYDNTRNIILKKFRKHYQDRRILRGRMDRSLKLRATKFYILHYTSSSEAIDADKTGAKGNRINLLLLGGPID